MFISDNDELFCSKIDDAVSLCFTRQKPVFTQFFSERKQALAKEYLLSRHFENFAFWGGCDNSERRVLGIFFDDSDYGAFPISAVEFAYRKCDELTHRDFLGTIMSLGIERDTVGDILVESGRCVVFLKSELKDYVVSQISKIGRTGVRISEPDLSRLPKGRGTEENSFTVSSLRLDNIVAAVCGLSREKTGKTILSGDVSLNFKTEQNVSRILKQGDTFTIRGKGKFTLNNILGVTKKGRLKISVIYFR